MTRADGGKFVLSQGQSQPKHFWCGRSLSVFFTWFWVDQLDGMPAFPFLTSPGSGLPPVDQLVGWLVHFDSRHFDCDSLRRRECRFAQTSCTLRCKAGRVFLALRPKPADSVDPSRV